MNKKAQQAAPISIRLRGIWAMFGRYLRDAPHLPPEEGRHLHQQPKRLANHPQTWEHVGTTHP